MRLSHITISGFKSFAKKVTIDVTHNVTGVVGPNGSGKSNVAEAIRFVLGEQSMKSMRGKLGADLIFKGSDKLSALSRASVTMTIDNKTKVESNMISQDLAPYLAYDEIILSRTIYADGTSDYTLNGAKVRLKDVQELLSFAGIGSSAHTIISQGEADKILLADLKTRKEAIEDALGLRVYHIRLNEAERKLERTKTHLREVDLLRKEIAPHLSHLKRQVEKIESKEVERKKLEELLGAYLKREEISLNDVKKKLDEAGSVSSLLLIADSIKKELEIERRDSEEKSQDIKVNNQTNKEEIKQRIHGLSITRDEITRNFGRLEAEKSFLEREINKLQTDEKVSISKSTLSKTGKDLKFDFENIKDSISLGKLNDARNYIDRGLTTVSSFFDVYKNDIEEGKVDELKKTLNEITDKIKKEEGEEKVLNNEIKNLQDKLNDVEVNSRMIIENKYEREKKIILLEGKLREFESTVALRRQEESEYNIRFERFNSLLNEGTLIVGRVLLSYKEINISDTLTQIKMEDLLRQIDKSKFKIEEAGIPNQAEVMEEYKSVSEREEYLKKELEDIKNTEDKLIELIDELKSSLDTKFDTGVKEISNLFTKYFEEVFAGGKASLSIVPIIKVDDEGNEIKETGVDIHVSLPSKKVKDISMFSGGERALVSIALLFAMSSLLPPPFMVLDETDAPLDESNASKYGAMLTRLATKSKLLVITHNRETMNHCEMLYGVTLGAEGCSKLLSVNLGQK